MEHTHKTAVQRPFSNTKYGWFEVCECGASRNMISGEFRMVVGEWQTTK